MDLPQSPDVSDHGPTRKQVRQREPRRSAGAPDAPGTPSPAAPAVERRRRRERPAVPVPQPSSGPVLVHTIRLSETVTAELALPDKLSVADAERIASVVLALAAD
ncbi:hypothetical protein KIH31_16060 [Paenarthrobacter sp. DKR-5]|uniref:hypothetical protein n=1 Tax=Paenarthrobacter sp. DKR-5 TaxID=2835535 RepID=UPI001BDD034F|nr:hypothetical protein [Paenarthrobacter sp. DKR-5]MBT1004102.1 hypothetical protein [Paenarthrobacter sp. DKR-5]